MLDLNDRERKEWNTLDELLEIIKLKYNSDEDFENDVERELLDTINGKYNIENLSDKEIKTQIQYIFSRRVRKILKERDMKENELAEKIGVSKGTITRYLRGNIFPTLPNMAKIAKALDVTPSYLIGFSNIICEENTELLEIYSLFVSNSNIAFLDFLKYSKNYVEIKQNINKTNDKELKQELYELESNIKDSVIRVLNNIVEQKENRKF